MRNLVRFGLVLAGVLLMQLAWILVIPPFGGIDEHEHVFKAFAVADGDLSPHHTVSSHDWGELVSVPRSIVEAARPQCKALRYTHDENCVGVPDPDGRIRVASSAARYNPMYYAFVGLTARGLDGTTALYAMRAMSSGVCALLIAVAFVVTRRCTRTVWPGLVLLLAMTPTAVYSTSLVAPNGVELCGGLLLWCALVGLGRGSDHPDPTRTRALLAIAAAASVPLLTVRTLGPLWWVLIVVGAAMTLGLAQTRRLLRLRPTWLFLGVSTICGAYGLGWSLMARSNGFGGAETTISESPWPGMVGQYVLWFCQTIAAAPLRNNALPTVVYAIAFLAIGIVAVPAIAAAASRIRRVLAYVILTASVVGVGATVPSFHQLGYAWQGRYFYPFTIGFFVLLGLALDGRIPRLSFSPKVAAGAIGAALCAMHLISLLALRHYEMRTSPLAGTEQWHIPSSPLLVVLTCAGSTLLLLGTVVGRRDASSGPRGARQPSLKDRATV